MSVVKCPVTFFTKYIQKTQDFSQVANKVKILSIAQGNCKGIFKVDLTMSNPLQQLHGGFSATLIDIFSTIALWSHQDNHKLNSAISMDIKYISGIPTGNDILIEAKTISSRKKIGFVEVSLLDSKNNELMIKGTLVRRFVEHKMDSTLPQINSL